MNISDLSICFHTARIAECRDFYVSHFGAVVTFECDWYISVQFEGKEHVLCFMDPSHEHAALYREQGVTLNLQVDDVDAEYKRLSEAGMGIVEEITDTPWGDRSFSIKDPIGNILYIYSPRPPSAEYADAFKN